MKKTLPITLFFLAIGLSLLGILIIMSSSADAAYDKCGDPYYFVKKQILWLLIGLSLQIFIMKIGYKKISEFSPYIFAGGLVLLILVLIPGFSTEIGGARRWLRLGPIGFQPSEFMKIITVIFMAGFLANLKEDVTTCMKGFVKPVFIIALVLLLVLAEKDLGTSIIIAIVLGGMLFAAGVRKKYLLMSIVMSAPMLVYAIWRYPFRMKRITAFLNPWNDPQNAGYQIIQSLMAISSGKWFGCGLGKGIQKYYYLPEAHTDFIFSIFAEETGFLGSFLLIALFTFLILMCIRICLKTVDRYSYILAIGLTMLIGIQIFINIGVVTSILPTKGTPLPFISFGGSSLVVNLIAIGILITIEKESREINP